MALQQARQFSPHKTLAQQATSQFAARPLPVRAQLDSDRPPTHLADSEAQSLEQAARFGHHFANIPIDPPDTQASTLVQRKEMTDDGSSASTEQRPNHTGLPDHLKAGIENLSGFSLDNVKVHYHSDKPAQLNALAYTQGTDIHVAPGQERHLPHEAWHVVQQAQGRVQPTMQLKDGVPVNDDTGLEYEADVMGAKAAVSVAQSQGASEEPVQGRFAPVQGNGHEYNGLHTKKPPAASTRSDPAIAPNRPAGQATTLQRYVLVNNAAGAVTVNAIPGAGGPLPAEFEAQQPLAAGQVGQVLVAGAPANLRVSEDGRMAIEDSNLSARQPKVFYAEPGVWQASNALLTQSRYELYADRANAITVTLPGQAPHNLDRVLARVKLPAGGVHAATQQGIGLEVDPDCIIVASAIIGQPVAPATERELVIAGGGGISRYLGEYQTAAAMLAWARAQSLASWAWPGAWWELISMGPASRATRLALVQFQAALGGGAGMQAIAQQYALLKQNNPNLAEQVAQSLGVNVHAQPGVGQAYESYQLGLPTNFAAGPGPDWEADPTGATMANLTTPTPGAGAGMVRHGWGQHIGAVIAESAGNRVTLENYARSHELGAMRTGPDYYFQMYGPPHLPHQTWHYAWTAGAVAAGIAPVKNAVTIVVRQ
jgi:hypothetical protein